MFIYNGQNLAIFEFMWNATFADKKNVLYIWIFRKNILQQKTKLVQVCNPSK